MRKEEERRRTRKKEMNPKRRKISSYPYSILIIVMFYIHLIDIQKEGKLIIIFY